MLATATIVNNNQVTIILALRILSSKVRYHSSHGVSVGAYEARVAVCTITAKSLLTRMVEAGLRAGIEGAGVRVSHEGHRPDVQP